MRLEILICVLIMMNNSCCNALRLQQKVCLSSATTLLTLFLDCSSLLPSSSTSLPILSIQSAAARNLPTSNDAVGKNRGKLEALIPIVKMATITKTAQRDLPDLKTTQLKLKLLPLLEKDFKKLFDEYSENISYKQVFLDQNAFLVYYSGGFDGPNRPNIETESDIEKREKLQYGYRNDAWIAIDDARAEVDYLLENHSNDIKDLNNLLTSANNAFENYLQLSLPSDVEAARISIEKK